MSLKEKLSHATGRKHSVSSKELRAMLPSSCIESGIVRADIHHAGTGSNSRTSTDEMRDHTTPEDETVVDEAQGNSTSQEMSRR